jgi:hypothetical protein
MKNGPDDTYTGARGPMNPHIKDVTHRIDMARLIVWH